MKEVTKGVRDVELEDEQTKPKAPAEGEADEAKEETQTGAEEAAAVPLPDSPQMKAAEEDKEDVDAEGEEDVEGKEADAATDATAVEDGSSSGKEDEPAVAATEDEVPGLTLASESPKKPSKAKTRSATKEAQKTAAAAS